jgi:hypothetical protein
MSRIFGKVRQMGYVVCDIEAAMKHWAEVLGVGPWVYTKKIITTDFRYNGKPYDLDMSIAVANSGDIQIELIQQRSDTPSMYRDFLQAHGEGFHHMSAWTTDINGEVERLLKMGYKIGQEGVISESRFVYFDTEGLHPCTVYEIYDVSNGMIETFDQLRETAELWDGNDAICRVDPDDTELN